MAARRGELAFEVDPLGHGLFTYTLLRGLGATRAREGAEADRRVEAPPQRRLQPRRHPDHRRA